MSSFSDNSGNKWTLRLTVYEAKLLRETLGVDVFNVEDLLNKIYEPVTLVDCLYLICKKQADERSVTDEEFGTLFNGDTIEQATKCFLDVLVNFTPASKRETLTLALNKVEKVISLTQETAVKAVAAVDTDKIAEELAKMDLKPAIDGEAS